MKACVAQQKIQGNNRRVFYSTFEYYMYQAYPGMHRILYSLYLTIEIDQSR